MTKFSSFFFGGGGARRTLLRKTYIISETIIARENPKNLFVRKFSSHLLIAMTSSDLT